MIVDKKLHTLKQYINILKQSDSYIENIGLVNDSQFKKNSMNIDIAINYFTILHNFLIIERMFSSIVKLSNKELNKYLELENLTSVGSVLSKFNELYDVDGKVRFAVETFDSIEEIRILLTKRGDVYDKLM